jgi:very-short-patch-repair endonuclease
MTAAAPPPRPDRPAPADKPAAPAVDCRVRPRDRTVPDNHALAGTVCRFEPVRGLGDREMFRLADLQHGALHLQQLRAASIGRHALAHRVDTGQLRRLFPSVYAVGRAQTDLHGRSMAALLHFKGDALASATSAAELWSLVDTTQQSQPNRCVEVLLVGRNAEPTPGIRIHRTRTLARQDIRWRHGIPLTSPARTLLDLAAILDQFELESALSAAFRRSAVRRNQLADVISRNPHAKGVGRLRTLVEATAKPRDTRSDYERRLLALLREAELPLPQTNAYVGPHMVDMLWPDLKFIVEFDSWSFHGDRASFEEDRLRDQVLATADHQVMRITARHLDHTPTALVARLAAIMTARRLSR